MHLFPFSWYIVRLQSIIFKMVNDDRKQERRRTSKLRFYYTLLEKAGHPLRIDWQQFWTKKPESVPGFQPSLSMQNAIALPLVPPPLPTILAQASTPHPYRPASTSTRAYEKMTKSPQVFTLNLIDWAHPIRTNSHECTHDTYATFAGSINFLGLLFYYFNTLSI